MHPMLENLLTMLLGQAISSVPALIRQYADATRENPPEPDPTDPNIYAAVSILANAIATGIAHTAYQASLERPHVARETDKLSPPTS
jgi:hypothetical protein